MARTGKPPRSRLPKMSAGPEPAPPKLPSATTGLSAGKAKQILSDGTVRGNPLTPPQKGLFGAIAGGAGAGPPRPTPRPTPPAIGQRPVMPRTKARMAAAAKRRY
jgi:hypothetical protein